MASLNEKDIAELNRLRAEVARVAAKVDGIKGEGITNSARSISFGPPRKKTPKPQQASGDDGLWMIISGNTQDGTNKRWTYDVTETTWTSGFTWGEPDTAKTGKAYNTIETNNGASVGHPWGNGVDSDNLSGTFDIQPIANGAIAWCRFLGTTAGIDYYAFEAVNQIDGECL